ncbi:hypothetical protein [Catellatospora citrea]|uniref:Uncharacterized protein n=1 Tax=Catellatospora citrea TaxID=53366 RepID=A0A8J3KBN3_9ACTN|nr:hypothetical protein [Catellatospora citrea]RKE05661.1 hypothetical protein C8E86_0469 [Catellatospora citrea]GIF97021.1 hypothetical protein Cci01nite_21150 [Catellatospora citrea]
MLYIRFEAAEADEHGRRTGIFGLANGLARSGALSPEDWTWWRSNNDWLDDAYPDPGKADPMLFDKSVHPHATCWFKDTAVHLLDRVPGYLALLERYKVSWREVRSTVPGVVLYEDADQIVVTPSVTARTSSVVEGVARPIVAEELTAA